MSDTKEEIQKLADHWIESLKARNVDALLEHYADDVVAFDVPPPHSVTGKAAIRRNIENWLNMFKGPIDVEIKEAEIEASGELAILRQHARVSDRAKGKESGMWVRATVCYRKQGEKWLVIHEHTSIPAGM